MLKIFSILMLLSLSTFSQTNYLMTLANPNQINNKSFEFDVTIQSLDTTFSLTSYQCSFSFDVNISDIDSISLEYIEDSSELENRPMNIIGYLTNDGINEIIFTSGVGGDQITKDSLLVGKFLVSGTMDLPLESLNFSWNFGGSVNTIITGENFVDITQPSNHKNFDLYPTSTNFDQELPKKFELSQNYPNPFNPTTKITFTNPTRGRVKLKIYNILGQKVMDVIDEIFSDGSHIIEVDGRSLTSGTYFYQIETADIVETKKMILIK